MLVKDDLRTLKYSTFLEVAIHEVFVFFHKCVTLGEFQKPEYLTLNSMTTAQSS